MNDLSGCENKAVSHAFTLMGELIGLSAVSIALLDGDVS